MRVSSPSSMRVTPRNIGIVIAGAVVIAVAWYLLSPLWNVVELDEQSPLRQPGEALPAGDGHAGVETELRIAPGVVVMQGLFEEEEVVRLEGFHHFQGRSKVATRCKNP